MRQFGECAAEVMGRQFRHADPPAIFHHRFHDVLRQQERAGQLAPVVHGAENAAVREPRGFGPLVDRDLCPGGHGDGAQAVSFAVQVHDGPAAVALLDVRRRPDPRLRCGAVRSRSARREARGRVCLSALSYPGH